MITTSHRILLLEPSYRNKYPPLGLMKIAAYHKERGHQVTFMKDRPGGYRLGEPWDRAYVTTLFSFEWKRTAAAIDFAIRATGDRTDRVFVGGIAASLMQDEFLREDRWNGVRFIRGLLVGPPAEALRLGPDEFGSGDMQSRPIEERVPDYGILNDVDYIYPVHDAYFGYASRGCIRKCAFCGVPKLEGEQRDMPPLATLVNGIADAYEEKKDLVLMDNNITASPRYREVIAEIRDLGFVRGAKLDRDGGRPLKRRVDFNQGVDARILARSPMYLKEMGKICIDPLRIAFDHIGVRKVYESAVRMAADNQITSLSNYMLYNFMDTPSDLYRRMRINIDLNEELGVRIWSFPMRYQPVNLKDRSHIGRNWNRYSLRSFQMILQATRGIVSGNPAFFDRAYGSGCEQFKKLLSLPHAFIFHRSHYEKGGDGEAVRAEYENLRARMSDSQEREFLAILGSCPANERSPREYYRRTAASNGIGPLFREALGYHPLDTRDKENEERILSALSQLNPDPVMPPDDVIVEDAGLFDAEYGQEKAAIQRDEIPDLEAAGPGISAPRSTQGRPTSPLKPPRRAKRATG